jgi:hypothetical protein
MAIWRRAGSALCVVAAVAAVVGLGAAPAMASTTLTVKVKSGGSITAVTSKTVLTDITKGGPINVTCTSTKKTPASKATGSISNGTHRGAAPVKVGTTTKLSFSNCIGPLGPVSTKVEIPKSGYTIAVDSTTTKSGDTDGIIGPVKVAVSMTGCSFTVTGSTPGYWNNKKHTLNVTPKLPTKALKSAQLTISGVTGCAGLVVNGQHPTYVGTYSVSRKVTITSS